MGMGRAVEIDLRVMRGTHETEEIDKIKPTPNKRGDNPKGILKETLEHETQTLRKTRSVKNPRKNQTGASLVVTITMAIVL